MRAFWLCYYMWLWGDLEGSNTRLPISIALIRFFVPWKGLMKYLYAALQFCGVTGLSAVSVVFLVRRILLPVAKAGGWARWEQILKLSWPYKAVANVKSVLCNVAQSVAERRRLMHVMLYSLWGKTYKIFPRLPVYVLRLFYPWELDK